ncbi:hypothetical protein Tco_0948069, partial [Tanacetum coccineum]
CKDFIIVDALFLSMSLGNKSCFVPDDNPPFIFLGSIDPLCTNCSMTFRITKSFRNSVWFFLREETSKKTCMKVLKTAHHQSHDQLGDLCEFLCEEW